MTLSVLSLSLSLYFSPSLNAESRPTLITKITSQDKTRYVTHSHSCSWTCTTHDRGKGRRAQKVRKSCIILFFNPLLLHQFIPNSNPTPTHLQPISNLTPSQLQTPNSSYLRTRCKPGELTPTPHLGPPQSLLLLLLLLPLL